MRALPLVDNLCSWQTVFPSQCVFYRMHSDKRDHLFLQCHAIRPIWQEISALLSGPAPRHSAILGYLIRWWRTSSAASMAGQLRSVTPSLAA